MFRIIAVRPLEGCAKHVLKCLKVDTTYYLCNEFQIEGSCVLWRKNYCHQLQEDFFEMSSDEHKEPHISISAIVGMNGDGKSSLTELIIRLINNCAINYGMDPQERLLPVKNVNAELYFQSENSIYRIINDKNDCDTKVQLVATVKNGEIKNIGTLRTLSSKELGDGFFYTLVNNYSHYAYNLRDFKEEINNEIVSNNEDEKYWLYRIFHKNDGYQTPISLHPYRKRGNIDINREKELSDQRLLSLIMSSTSTSRSKLLLDINGKEPYKIELTLLNSTKLRENTIKERFESCKNINWLGNIATNLHNIFNKRNAGQLLLKFQKEDKDDIIGSLHSMAKSIQRTIGGSKLQCSDYLRGFLGLVSKNKDKYLPLESDINKLLSVFERNLKADERLPEIVSTLGEFREMSLAQLQWALFIIDVINFWSNGLDFHGKRIKFQVLPKTLTSEERKLTLITKSQHYIIYKTISIFNTYPDYRQTMTFTRDAPFFSGHSEDKVFIEELLAEGYKTLQRDCDEKSHITLKLRQTLRFYADLKNNVAIWDDKDIMAQKQEKGLEELVWNVDIAKLRKKYGENTFEDSEKMPPRIFTWDLIFQIKGSDENKDIPYRMFSSGEKQFLQVIGAVMYHIHNIDSIASTERRYRNVNLIFEEIELYFHPEWQRKLVWWLMEMLRSIKYQWVKNVNIVLVTHSPFVLSDIPKANVLFLREGKPVYEMQSNTFGANIHNLLKNGFFLPGLPMGEFAHKKIDSIFEKLNSGVFPLGDVDKILNDVLQVGEPVLKNELMMLLGGYKALQADKKVIEEVLKRIK